MGSERQSLDCVALLTFARTGRETIELHVGCIVSWAMDRNRFVSAFTSNVKLNVDRCYPFCAAHSGESLAPWASSLGCCIIIMIIIHIMWISIFLRCPFIPDQIPISVSISRIDIPECKMQNQIRASQHGECCGIARTSGEWVCSMSKQCENSELCGKSLERAERRWWAEEKSASALAITNTAMNLHTHTHCAPFFIWVIYVAPRHVCVRLMFHLLFCSIWFQALDVRLAERTYCS